MSETDKMPIALLIGAGSRIPKLLDHLSKPDAPALVTAVVSHKALQPDANGEKTQDVVGIVEAKKYGIPTAYFNLIQMRNAARDAGLNLDEKKFREEYFRMLGAYLCQNYPVRPRAVFMLGWDLVTSEEFLKFFPGPKEGLYNVINLHPAQLPDKPGDMTVKLSSGIEIPVIEGEHDKVLKEAIRLKLPALGACMHYAQAIPDLGGTVIKRVEVPIIYKDTDEETYDDYEQRLKEAESQLVVEVIDDFARGKITI